MKNKVIKIHEDKKTKELFFKLKDLFKGTTVKPDDVKFYELKKEGDVFILSVYDENKKLIEVREK